MDWNPIFPLVSTLRAEWSQSEYCNFRVLHKGEWLKARLKKAPAQKVALSMANEMIRYYELGASTCYCCWSRKTCTKSEVMI